MAMMRVKDRQGFTLIEILVVVFILGLLAAIVAPQLIGRTDDAKITEAKVQIRNMETALKLFKLDNGFYPTTQQGLSALVASPTSGQEAKNFRKGGYLEKGRVPADPWGNEYIYVSPGVNNEYEIISLGADGREGGEDINADITSWDL